MGTTIGIPVYNEVKYLENTLKSVDGQADQIIICDNASTDGTEDICRRFQDGRPYVRYERFSRNMGAGASFRRCLELADTEYFMWVGAHDLIVNDHVRKLAASLDENPDAMLAYANALHLDMDYRFLDAYYYDWHGFLMADSPLARVSAIVAALMDCTMFHGLYRRGVLEEYFSEFHRRASIGDLYIDHVILAYVAWKGKLALVPDSHYIRLTPRTDEPLAEAWSRALKAMKPGLPVNPDLFPMTIYKGQRLILEELRKAPDCDIVIWADAVKALERWRPVTA